MHGGGKTRTALHPIYGAPKAARYVEGLLKKLPANFSVRLAHVNGQTAIIGYLDGAVYQVLILEVADGQIQAMRFILNPDKLRHIPKLPDT